MVERTVTARFRADVNQAIRNVDQLSSKITGLVGATKELGTSGKTSFRGFDDNLSKSATAAQKFAKNQTQATSQVSSGLLALGATAGVGIGLAVKKFAEFDKEMSNVKAATGETAGNMDLLREAALKAGKDTSFSATEAAQGIEALAKAGISAKNILTGGLTGALSLAAAGQISVADASETAATALTQFKLQGKDIPHIADLLAAGAGKAQGDVSDMAAALKQGGLVASDFGLSIEETTGTLAAFASAGLIGSDAGTSFKTMLLALASPSKQAAEVMKQLGINAYDAQGAFIGIAPLADQLKMKLSGLSQEQRNAALSTIFGTDAIRAASVLYDQGGKGIVDWTTKVNDTGYAATQAATKMDNLSGDLERLRGSFDTALIQGGSGANDVLRGLVQAADGAVSAFSSLPDAVTGVATGLAAVVAVGGLAAGGTLKAASAAGQLKEAWGALGKTGRTLTASMGAIGVALVAAGLIYSAFTKRNEETKARVDNFRSTLDEATGAITGNTRAYVANDLAQSGLAEKAKGFGLSLSSLTDAALGNKGALSGLTGELDKLITANTVAQDTSGGNAPVLNKQGQAASDLKDKILGLSSSLSEAQKQQQLAAEGANTGKTAVQLEAEAHKVAAAAAQQQTASLNDLIATMLKLPGQVLGLRDAQRQYQASIDDATASLKDNGRTLDINTPKGRSNADALDKIAKSANDVTKTLRENGAGQSALASHLKTSEASLYKAARAFGLSDAAAKAYVKSVRAVPEKAATKITNNAPVAKAKVDPYTKALNLLPKTKTTGVLLNGAAAARQQVLNLSGAINNLPSQKNIYVKMIQSGSVGGIPAGIAAPKADGGQLPGISPGPRADNIAFMGTAGEWVQPNASVDYYGPGFMAAVQTRRFPKTAAQGFKDGGQLGINRYADGGPIGGLDILAIMRMLFAAPGNPLSGINVGQLLTAARTAARVQVAARAELTKQQRERNSALATQTRLDAELKNQNSRIATLRTNKSSDSSIRHAQLEQISLQKQLNAAKANTKVQNTQVTAAEKAYTAAANGSVAASDRYKTSIQALNQVKEQATALARQVADTQLQGTDVSSLATGGSVGLLAGKQAKGKSLGAFAGTLERLNNAGLSKELLDQLRAGGLGNATVASQILSSGQGYIKQLNSAESILQAQASRIGAGAAAQAYSVAYLTTNIEIGGEVVRTVQQVIRSNQAATKAAVTRR